MDAIGPVEFAVVEFPTDSLPPEIARALADLVDAGIISIIDLLFVSKDGGGEIEVVELADANAQVSRLFEDVDGEVRWLLSEEDINAAAEVLDPGTSGLLVVWVNAWADPLRAAVGKAGGRLVVHDRIDPAVVAAITETSGG